MPPIIQSPTSRALAQAVELLRAGECVGIPTETVYGLAADGLNPDAVKKIFATKGRPATNPLILHLPDGLDNGSPGTREQSLKLVARELSPVARALMDTFWPGPLTLVLPKASLVPDEVTAGLDTVAVRSPKHPVARELLSLFGRPLAAPSANKFQQLSPTTAEAVEDQLGELIQLVLDGGACEIGIESTIIDCSTPDHVKLLRKGSVTSDLIQEVVSQFEDVVWDASEPIVIKDVDQAQKAPGMLEAHYAPRTPLYQIRGELSGEETFPDDVGLLLYQESTSTTGSSARRVEYLSTGSPSASHDGNVDKAAANLYQKLRTLDHSGCQRIFVEALPDGAANTHEQELLAALKDRLRRASKGTISYQDGKWEACR